MFANLLLFKAPSKNDFLKDVESKVVCYSVLLVYFTISYCYFIIILYSIATQHTSNVIDSVSEDMYISINPAGK